jgi:DNA-binding transcriptional MerR regulator
VTQRSSDAGSVPASGGEPGVRRTIGAVLAALTPEFPDLTISKIRFLEAEGLLTPHRTGSGYRTYTDRDIERLRYILTAQRDRFWPLRVIRDALDAIDRGLSSTEGDGTEGGRPRAPDVAADPDVPSAEHLAAPPALRLTSRELRDAAGLDRPTLDALETFGLIRPDAGGHFDEDALTIARSAAALAAYGVEPRHLRPFRTAADREIGLVQQLVRPARSSGRNARTTEGDEEEDLTPELLRLCVTLHTALVRAGLHRR